MKTDLTPLRSKVEAMATKLKLDPSDIWAAIENVIAQGIDGVEADFAALAADQTASEEEQRGLLRRQLEAASIESVAKIRADQEEALAKREAALLELGENNKLELAKLRQSQADLLRQSAADHAQALAKADADHAQALAKAAADQAEALAKAAAQTSDAQQACAVAEAARRQAEADLEEHQKLCDQLFAEAGPVLAAGDLSRLAEMLAEVAIYPAQRRQAALAAEIESDAVRLEQKRQLLATLNPINQEP